jgi:aerobic C4-dicarboxylate transport protein
LIGIVVAHFIQPGKGVNISEIKGGDISAYVKQSKEFSWWNFFKENITLQIVVFSIIAGIILNRLRQKERIIKPLKTISDYVFKGLHLVMILAPLGAFGGMAYTYRQIWVAYLAATWQTDAVRLHYLPVFYFYCAWIIVAVLQDQHSTISEVYP